MKKFTKILNVTVAVATLVASNILPTEGFAAVQGTLGATSTGSVNINVTKPARADINNLSDMTLASWVNGDAAPQLTEDVCVYSSKANGGYTIKATGSGTASAFTLANGANLLPYSVTWNSGGVGALANTGTALTANVTSAGLTGASRDSSTCSGATPGMTARLVVGMTTANMDSIVDGIYAGTLTMLVTPN